MITLLLFVDFWLGHTAPETATIDKRLEMEKRIDFKEAYPEGYNAMLALGAAVKPKLLPIQQVELMKIRASQINGCAFCLGLHINTAKRAGETDERINFLAAWEEVDGLYNDVERALLALTEEMTTITRGVSDETYAKAAQVLTPVALAEAIMVVAAINTWNRILKTTHKQPELHG